MTIPAPNRFRAAFALSMLLACSSAACVLVDATMAPPASAQPMEVDDGYFYSSLASDGEWFYQAQFGWVWHPTRVDAGWRPYTDGRWLWSDDSGWVWATSENWGWATYHYGRWYFDPVYAWSWVPGRVWAPAWVSWRVEAGYVGWAPLWPAYFDLHPEYRWDRWGHDDDWDRRHGGRDWDRWVFTRDRDFTSDHVGRYAVRDRRERDRLYSTSRDVTRGDESRPDQRNRGIDRRAIEQATGRTVPAVKLQPSDRREQRYDAGAGRLEVFRPRVKESRDKTPDRLGLAKEPSKDGREHDTIRVEKKRLDAVPAQGRTRDQDREPSAVRGNSEERGDRQAPAAQRSPERRPQEPKQKADRPQQQQQQQPKAKPEKEPRQQQQQQRQQQQQQQDRVQPEAATPNHPDREQARPERTRPEQPQPAPKPPREQRDSPQARPEAPQGHGQGQHPGQRNPQASPQGDPSEAQPSSPRHASPANPGHGQSKHAPKPGQEVVPPEEAPR